MQIAYILKVNINRQQKTNTSWLVTKTKVILKTPIQKLDKPIFSFKRTNKAAARNNKILEVFNNDLGTEISAPKVSPLNYGS